SMHHPCPLHCSQRIHDLLGKLAHTSESRRGIALYPLSQGLAFNVLTAVIQKTTGSNGLQNLHHIGMINTPSHPLLSRKTFEILRVFGKSLRRRLHHELLPKAWMTHQIKMT